MRKIHTLKSISKTPVEDTYWKQGFLLRVTHKLLHTHIGTTQLPHLISVQRPHSTRSSSTVARHGTGSPKWPIDPVTQWSSSMSDCRFAAGINSRSPGFSLRRYSTSDQSPFLWYFYTCRLVCATDSPLSRVVALSAPRRHTLLRPSTRLPT